jgi:hypothetical protein
VPDTRTGKTDHRFNSELGRRSPGVCHLLGSSLADTLGITVAPDAGGQDRLVTLIDWRVADRLANQMV